MQVWARLLRLVGGADGSNVRIDTPWPRVMRTLFANTRRTRCARAGHCHGFYQRRSAGLEIFSANQVGDFSEPSNCISLLVYSVRNSTYKIRAGHTINVGASN